MNSQTGSDKRCVVMSRERHFDFIRTVLPTAELTEELPEGGGWRLITLGSGVIIPKETLAQWEEAVNFHGAPPMFPGRDPHHWAAYENAGHYGATVHAIWPKVDEGPICGQILLGVSTPKPPEYYRAVGESAMYALFMAWASQSEGFGYETGFTWSGTKRKRKDLLEMCDFRGVSPEERERRRKAFAGFESRFIE